MYTIILSPDPDLGGFTAICPAMPGAVADGRTRLEAIEAIRGVMEVWVEVAAEDGYGPLAETPELIGRRIGEIIEDRDESGWDRSLETCMVDVRIPVAA